MPQDLSLQAMTTSIFSSSCTHAIGEATKTLPSSPYFTRFSLCRSLTATRWALPNLQNTAHQWLITTHQTGHDGAAIARVKAANLAKEERKDKMEEGGERREAGEERRSRSTTVRHEQQPLPDRLQINRGENGGERTNGPPC